jgi:TRAP-type C4-dicarboxylate transport system substrate-binding protein
MKSLRIGFILSIIAILCFLYMGTGKAISAEKTIRIGSAFLTGHILVDAAEKFKELIEGASGGRIAVQLQLGGKSEEEIVNLNSAGAFEIQSNGTQFLQLKAPPYYFFTNPYVMKDFEHYMRVWDGKLGQQACAEMEKNGNLKFLGTVYRGMRQMTAKKPIYTPADVYGVKMRLPVIPSWIAVWKAIGADPVPLTLPGDVSQITSFKLDEVQTYLIMTNHLAQTGGMLIYKPFFDGLSKADQTLVTMAAKQACDWANAKMKAAEFSYVLELQRKGMQVVIPDADSFRVKAKATVEQLFKTDWPVTTWAEVLSQ